jgi:hypothetical protein
VLHSREISYEKASLTPANENIWISFIFQIIVPVAKLRVKFHNPIFFSISETTSLEIGSQIIDPSQSTALPASQQTCEFGDNSPAVDAIVKNEVHESMIFFYSPWTSLQSNFVTARFSPH